MSVTTVFPFTDETNYTYDSDKIEITGGVGKLKLIDNPGQDFTQEFTSDTGFTYDSTYTEFSGGQVQQKDTRPADATLYAGFPVDEDSSWGGNLNNTLLGGAVWDAGTIDLQGKSGRRLNIPGSLGNFDTIGTAGCIRFVYIPGSNSPTGTEQILEYDASVGNNGAIFISFSGTTISIDLRDSSGTARWMYATGITLTQDQRYVFELNFDFDSTSRFFIDGIQEASLNTSAWTRNASSGTFKWGGATGTGDFNLDDVILFSTVQHTSNHAGELPYTYYNNIYNADVITVPEMEYTGAGTLVTFDAFTTTEAGAPRYTLQIGQSGYYLYWNGVAWVTSDNTYAQANDATTFNTNVASLNINGEIYGQFRIYTTVTNTQASVDELTASLTAQIYPTDNPTITINTAIRHEGLEGFTEVSTVTGSDALKYTISKNGTKYYVPSNVWTVSDTTYPQTSTAAEIETDKATFTTTPVDMTIVVYLHSDDGSSTPEIDSLTIDYNFRAPSADTISRCIVYGYNYDLLGAISTETITITLNGDAIKYKDNVILQKSTTTVTPESGTGYWEAELIENENMRPNTNYTFNFGHKTYTYPVPNEVSRAFWELDE